MGHIVGEQSMRRQMFRLYAEGALDYR